jgi:hypothetical protein
MKSTQNNRAGLRRPGESRWHAALRVLAMPAQRVHNYRNLHRSMFYEAMGQLDCKDKS